MKNSITGRPLFDVPTIPDCSDLLSIPSIKRSGMTPDMIAAQMLESVRYWRAIHPGRDWLAIVPPPWRDYISYNIKEIEEKYFRYETMDTVGG